MRRTVSCHWLRTHPIGAIWDLGSAQNPYAFRVRAGFCVLSSFKLAALITPVGIGSNDNKILIIFGV